VLISVTCAQAVLKMNIWVDKNRGSIERKGQVVERKGQVDTDAQETSRASKSPMKYFTKKKHQ